MAGSNALVFRHDHLARLVADVETGDFATQTLWHQGELDVLPKCEIVKLEEAPQNLFIRHTQRAEQRGDRHLAATVDTEEERVFRVKLEVDPRTAIRNHTSREEQFARGVGLTAIMFEEHPRRTMQLADDDTFCAVDHEGTRVGHERNLAHVDFLLLDFFNITGITVEDDQTHTGAQRRCEGQATLLTFAHVEGRFSQVVADKLEACIAGMRRDREDRRKSGLQTLRTALCRRDSLLQKITEGVELGRQKVRYLEHRVTLRKALADALFLGK